MRARIIGGGVAGLSLAIALQRRAGIDGITVYERETSKTLPQKLGHGLILMENGVSALEAIDAVDVLAESTALRRTVIQDRDGALLHSEAMSEAYSVTRAAIIEGLRAKLDPSTLQLAHRCVEVHLEPTAGGTRVCALSFAGVGREEIGEDEIVIDASGWRSPLCAALNPDFERKASRVKELVTSTALPELAARLGDAFVKTVFPERGIAFGLLAPTSERVIGFMQFDSELVSPPARGSSEAEIRRFLEAHLADAPPLVREYIERADLASAHVWHPADADLPPEVHCDNAVLIGDAAHPLLPFTSQGVSAALEDSIILADTVASILGADELPQALTGFAADRRADVSVYIDEGRRILEAFVAAEAPAALPFIEGSLSKLGEHLALPAPSLPDLFGALDLNNNGLLERREYARALDHLGLKNDVERTFAEIDVDASGGIDHDELRRGLRGATQSASSGLYRLRESLSPRGLGTLLRRLSAERAELQTC